MPLTATGIRVVMRQLAQIDADPIDGIRLHPCDDLSELRFDLDGPEGTPFADGRFHVALLLDEHYPEVPPKGYFRTKIFHPNVSDRGEICVNALKRDWAPSLGLRHVLVVIRCLLVEPNPESALNEEAGRLLLEDYADFERKVRMLTAVHARRPAGAARITLHAADNGQVTVACATDGPAPTEGASQPTESGGGAGPLRSLEGNACHGSGAGGGSSGSGKKDDADGGSAPAADKAKKKAAEKKKNALKRI